MCRSIASIASSIPDPCDESNKMKSCPGPAAGAGVIGSASLEENGEGSSDVTATWLGVDGGTL